MKNPYTRSADRSVPATEYAAFKEGAALVDLSHKMILRLSGKDPVGMLNAVLTNEVPEEEHRGVYALLLSPKGRIQADLRILKGDGDVLIDTEPEGIVAVKELLGRYASFSRLKLDDLSEADTPWGILGLYGPDAEELLDGLELVEHETAGVQLGGADLLAAGVAVPVPGCDLLGSRDSLSAAHNQLAARGAVPVSLPVYEAARVMAGIPRFGSDITPENLPAECGILGRAVSFEKGCYPGQEIVARMHYRGQPNKILRRFILEGSPPQPNMPIFQNEKQVGKVTSLAPLPVNGETFVLGYLSRNADTQDALLAGDATLRLLA